MNGTISIAGHKVPVMAVFGAVIGLGLLLVLRARSTGGSVAAAGTVQAINPNAQTSVFGPGPFASASDLAGVQAQLEGELQQGISSATAQAAALAKPGAPPTPTGTPDYVVRGLDGHAWVTTLQPGGGITGFQDIGGLFLDQPVVEQLPGGGEAIVGTGLDKHPWESIKTPAGTWSGWQQLPGLVKTA